MGNMLRCGAYFKRHINAVVGWFHSRSLMLLMHLMNLPITDGSRQRPALLPGHGSYSSPDGQPDTSSLTRSVRERVSAWAPALQLPNVTLLLPHQKAYCDSARWKQQCECCKCQDASTADSLSVAVRKRTSSLRTSRSLPARHCVRSCYLSFDTNAMRKRMWRH